MKKFVLAAAAVATLMSSTAYGAEDNMFYVKANAGWNKMTKIKSLKSNNDIFFGAGVGYYAMENVRIDLTFDHYVKPEHKGNIGGVSDMKLKSVADTLFVNGFVDLFDVSVAKVYAVAGFGVSMTSAKLTQPKVTDVKYKKKNNFAYALHVGASTEFAPGVNGELGYSYRDLGKLTTPAGAISLGNLKAHHVSLGIRFDI